MILNLIINRIRIYSDYGYEFLTIADDICFTNFDILDEIRIFSEIEIILLVNLD